MRRGRGHLSYANVAATLALVFAMSGGAIAATGGFSSASSSIKACAGRGGVLKLQTGRKCKKGQKAVTWNQTGPAGPQGAAGPSGIAGLNGAAVPNATNATSATTATTALTANNALSLGGIPASEFTRSNCFARTGQVRGFASIPTELGFTFSEVNGAYNCSGEPVEAERTTKGRYIVRFRGNPGTIAIGTGQAGPDSNVIGVQMLAPGEWNVQSFNAEKPEEKAGAFALLIP